MWRDPLSLWCLEVSQSCTVRSSSLFGGELLLTGSPPPQGHLFVNSSLSSRRKPRSIQQRRRLQFILQRSVCLYRQSSRFAHPSKWGLGILSPVVSVLAPWLAHTDIFGCRLSELNRRRRIVYYLCRVVNDIVLRIRRDHTLW